jgi:hypothetical protein
VCNKATGDRLPKISGRGEACLISESKLARAASQWNPMETNNIRAAALVMTNSHAVAKKVSPATWIGLFLSLFAMVVIRHAFVFFVPEITFAAAILKETLIWASAVALLVIIRRGERLTCAPSGSAQRAGGCLSCGDS